MQRTLMVALALSVSWGCAAWAQVGEIGQPLVGSKVIADGASPDDHRQPRGLKPGMVVIDRQGVKVGIILRVDETRDHLPSILLLHNGARFTVRTSKFILTPQGNEAVILLTVSELRTLAISNTE